MIVFKENYNNINILTIRDIDIDNDSIAEDLKNIIKKLTKGNEYYFEFFKENFFLDDEEVQKYRIEVPEYIKQNGVYTLKKKCDEEHLGSIGLLTVTDELFDQIIKMWKYFEGLSFFNPTNTFNWQKFEKIYDNIKPTLYGIGIIENHYADSVFIKGHDGDNLIFSYGSSFDQFLVNEVVNSCNKYNYF